MYERFVAGKKKTKQFCRDNKCVVKKSLRIQIILFSSGMSHRNKIVIPSYEFPEQCPFDSELSMSAS